MRIRARLLITALGLLGSVAGCTAQPVDDAGDGVARGPIGKADAAGTCELPDGSDLCGGKGLGACWCDDLCVDFGDCCHDADAVCGIDDAGGMTDDGGVDDGGSDDGEACSPVMCALACPYGFDTGDDGCEICHCHDPAGDFCGGIANFQCPEGFECHLVGNFPDAGGTCQPAVPAASCVDACGGVGSDGTCWCDDLCEGFGDCCDDFADACEPPAPETCDACGDDEVCVTRFTQLGPQISCAPLGAACDEGVPTCACMGAEVCTGSFDTCSENDGGLGCTCPVC